MIKKIIVPVLLALSAFAADAQFKLDYSVSLTGNAGSNGDFAPFYISSNTHGFPTQSKSGYLRAAAKHDMTTDTRFSYGFGVDLVGGAASGTDYQFYSKPDEKLMMHSVKPGSFWIQQLYAEIKYRGIFLTVGQKERGSALLNQKLSSGDLTWSGNARPMPEVRGGFIDFQDIPFTNGWVQIQGEYSMAKCMDEDWVKDHYNYNSSRINTGGWYNYKRMYFRTKPTQPFVVTVGMQAVAQIGGRYQVYSKGVLQKDEKFDITFKTMLNTLVPCGDSNHSFVIGNHLGSWDLLAEYKLKNGSKIKAYFEFPWEDGSGLGKMNGFDGLYGIEYQSGRKSWINGAVIEYFNYNNQAGPLNWDERDHANNGGHFPSQTSGGDNYYNNGKYPGNHYYGMSMGTPFIKSPIYNENGAMYFYHNLVEGFHVGVTGNILPELQYRILASYRTSQGTMSQRFYKRIGCTSAMLEAVYDIKWVKGLQAKCQFAFDSGKLYNDNFGALLSISYNGSLKF